MKEKQFERIRKILLTSKANRVRVSLWNTSGVAVKLERLTEFCLKGPVLAQYRIRQADAADITPFARQTIEGVLQIALALPSFRIDLEEINHGACNAPVVVATHVGEQWPRPISEFGEPRKFGASLIDPDGEGEKYPRCTGCGNLRTVEQHHFLCTRDGDSRSKLLNGCRPDEECPHPVSAT